jgi:hypothetical protein
MARGLVVATAVQRGVVEVLTALEFFTDAERREILKRAAAILDVWKMDETSPSGCVL